MREVFILYWGTETGSREDCSIFYTESEAFTTRARAEARAQGLKAANQAALDDEDEEEDADESFYTHIDTVEVVS